MKSRRNSPARRKTNTRVSMRVRRRQQWHVLDVKVRSSKETRLRRAANTRGALKFAAVILLFIGVAAGGRSVIVRTLYGDNGVILRNIDIRTDGSLTRMKVLSEVGLKEGDNLLEIDLASVQDRLTALPQVAGVEVVRIMPDTLVIALDERQPLAWINCPEAGMSSHSTREGYLLDLDGNAFRCEALLRSYLTLPVVTIEGSGSISEGNPTGSDQVVVATEIIRRSREFIPYPHWDIREVTVSKNYMIRVGYHNGADVIFGLEDLERQLEDLSIIAGHAQRAGREIASLNLALSRNIPVTYFDYSGRGETAPTTRNPGHRPAAGGLSPATRSSRTSENSRTRQLRGILGGA